MDLSHFNPNAQTEADFRAGFIARRSTLDFFLKQLALTLPGQPARQHLIVAPRGFGKTSMLRRIAIGVREDAALNARYLPLRFREEQHNVISLDLFWRNCLLSLLEAREDQGATQDELDAIDTDWRAHGPRQGLPRDEQDGEPARLVLYGRCAGLGRRPLLLIDNIDTLLAGLSAHHQWGLRRRLQADDGPVLIAAAPRYPDSTHDPDAAFYEFFRVQTLDKLADTEVFDCLRNLAVLRGAAGEPVLRLLAHDPGRIAALNTLAGGNPRTLGVLYAVLESHQSDDVLSQLGTMLDTFTGWYQARTEELPMQARAVFDALALNWDPMTAAALGLATGLDTPAVSSQLTRLEKSGYVETVALSSRGKGRSGYQVSERFFNIWYLMRNGSRRVGQSIRFLTQFVQACFNVGEQQTLAVPARAVGEAQSLSLVAFADSDAELPLIVEESRPHPDPLVRLPIPGQSGGPDWPAVFQAISSAMSGTDPAIGSTHIEDLQRLLWFILAQGQGQGQAFRQWMDKAGIRDRYAPLYHAFVAALDGEDHLLSINPEVRQPAARIHAGLARRLHPYGRDKLIRKSERSRRSG